MTKKYTKLLAPYCLGLSLLAAGNTYANTDLGDTGITLSGGVEIVAKQYLASPTDFGKKAGGRYFNKNEYFNLDATLTGTHNLNIWDNAVLFWVLDNSIYNKNDSAEFAKQAYLGVTNGFGTLQAGKFNTLTHKNIDYGQISGKTFSGAYRNNILDTQTSKEKTNLNVESFKQAIQYTIPQNLVKGLTAGVIVVADPNANAKNAELTDKSENFGTNRYPWAFDSLIKYTHTESGFTVLGTYSEVNNLQSDGTALPYLILPETRAYLKKSHYRLGVVKVGYNKNNLQITAGYRNLYSKESFEKSCRLPSGFYGTCYSRKTSQDYALAIDVGYTMGKHFVAASYETAPKFEKTNLGHIPLQQVSANYKYNITENLYADILVEHIFANNSSVSNESGFIKNSKTMLTTKLKYNF